MRVFKKSLNRIEAVSMGALLLAAVLLSSCGLLGLNDSQETRAPIENPDGGGNGLDGNDGSESSGGTGNGASDKVSALLGSLTFTPTGELPEKGIPGGRLLNGPFSSATDTYDYFTMSPNLGIIASAESSGASIQYSTDAGESWHDAQSGAAFDIALTPDGGAYTDTSIKLKVTHPKEPEAKIYTLNVRKLIQREWSWSAGNTNAVNGAWTAPAAGRYSMAVYGAKGMKGFNGFHGNEGQGGNGGKAYGDILLNGSESFEVRAGARNGGGSAGVSRDWSGQGGGMSYIKKAGEWYLCGGGGGGVGGSYITSNNNFVGGNGGAGTDGAAP